MMCTYTVTKLMQAGGKKEQVLSNENQVFYKLKKQEVSNNEAFRICVSMSGVCCRGNGEENIH